MSCCVYPPLLKHFSPADPMINKASPVDSKGSINPLASPTLKQLPRQLFALYSGLKGT